MSASERCRTPKALERKQARKFLGRGRIAKSDFRTVNKEMLCLLCVGTKLLELQTCPPTVVLVLEEFASRCPMLVNRHFSPFLSYSWGIRMEIVSGEPRVPLPWSPFWGLCSELPPAGDRETPRAGRGAEDEEALHGWGCPELCVLECSRAAGSGWEEHRNRWAGRRFEKVKPRSCFMHRGFFKFLMHRNAFLFKMKFTGTTRNSNYFAKGSSFLLLEQGLRHAFWFFPIFLPSASRRPFIVPVYFQDESVGSLCWDRISKPKPPAVSTLLL